MRPRATVPPMNVLITGATGFLGRELVASLTAQGHAVSALSRNGERARQRIPQLVAAWDWDLLAGPPPAEALAVDAVIHLAGETVAGRWTKRKKEAIHATRRDGTRHLVDGLGALPEGDRPSVLISTSAVGFYGERGEEEITEATPAGSDFLARVCKDWEAGANAAAAHGLRVVTMRMPIVLGARGGVLEQTVPMAKFGINGPLGSGQQWWCWVAVPDVCRFVADALGDASFEGAYNLCSPQPVRQIEFARALGRVLGRPSFLPTPAFALKLVLGEFSVEVLTSKRQLPARLQERGWTFAQPDLEEALRSTLLG